MYLNTSHLVIRLVFPTLWSPSKTILVRFGGADEKSAVTGVVGDSMANEDGGRPNENY